MLTDRFASRLLRGMGASKPTSPPRQPPVAGGLLVFGGSGFLGRHLLLSALETVPEGELVFSASRDPFAPVCTAVLPDTVVGHGLDATRPDVVERLLDELRPVRIVNCAALASVGRCEEDPGLATALNVELPARLASWTGEHGVRLVHVSTDLVFGGEPPHRDGYREADPVDPLTGYGRSKARGEEAVLARDPAALVVRLPLLYGDSHDTGRGASDSLIAAVKAEERPALFTDEWRSPLDVGNAARALVELSARTGPSGLLHIAGPDRLTRHDFGLLVLAARGLSARQAASLVRSSTRAEAEGAGVAGQGPRRPRDVCLDSHLARTLLKTQLGAVIQVLSARGPE